MPTMKNTVVKSVSPKSVFDSCENLVDATIDWNQGDFLVLDASAHLLKAVSGSAEDGANFCGIARCTIADGKVLSPYQGTDVDAAQGSDSRRGPAARRRGPAAAVSRGAPRKDQRPEARPGAGRPVPRCGRLAP